MKFSITNSFGIPMGLLLFQLQASQVACFGCENAGQARNGVRFQWPHCASGVRKEPYQGPNPGVQYQLMVDFVAPPWNNDHYDCTQADPYKIEACCRVPDVSCHRLLLYMFMCLSDYNYQSNLN
ncbi:hypothetical protein PGTUg99_011779 [Puccinia graminis f. sp. tritici]|uniref:Secreted protein n=1 Tax=Puccinia graminis f. sp. tritici TaxID=56615 RepID=A0A5B0Q1D5_PUCGR|nr:hypothetical protein PGTUg99_011779 [Puccinia graminis f. sp. tritici]